MKRASLLLVAALSAAPLGAADTALAPAQFAQGFALDAPGTSALYRLHLDEAVYRATQRADLRDMAVFNAAGEPVPQAFEPARAVTATTADEQALAFYPVPAEGSGAANGGLHLTVDAAGAVVSIDAPGGTLDRAQSAGSWIVDAGEQHAQLRALRLQWQDTGLPLVLQVTVRASTDLQHWQPLAQATLAALEHGGHQLRQDTIEVKGAPARFLRIDGAAGGPAIELQQAIGRVVSADVKEPERRFTVLHGEPAGGTDTGWVFDAGGPFPVDRLRVRLPQQNNLAELRVWSRAGSSARWIERGNVLAYRLAVDGATLESPVAQLPLTRERYWRIETVTGDDNALGAEPVIELGWQADALLFVARGERPFLLAVGSATRRVNAQAVASLLGSVGAAQQNALLGDATLGAARTLGGEAALEVPRPPVPWQRYLMWAVLVAAVAVLLRMALSLLRSA